MLVAQDIKGSSGNHTGPIKGLDIPQMWTHTTPSSSYVQIFRHSASIRFASKIAGRKELSATSRLISLWKQILYAK